MNRISKQSKIGFISTLIWGLFAHGMMLTNKFSWHDDIAELFDIGSTVQSGRWMLQVMKKFEETFFGGAMYSMPLFNGVISILCIAVIVAMLIHLFEIKSEFASVGLAGVMVAFPVITGIFGYMFTAPAYMIGLMMGMIGAYIICKYRKWYLYILALGLCACCVGTYQAFIPMMICVLVIYMMKSNMEHAKDNIPEIVREVAYYVASCVGFMVVYFVLNKIALRYYNIELLDYSGINNMGMTSIGGYISRIGLAYQEFFAPDITQTGNMFPMGMIVFYRVILVAMLVLSVYRLIEGYKKNIWNGIYLTALLVVFPLASNFIYFMCDIEAVHSLTVYGKAFVLVYFIFLLDKFELEEQQWKKYVAKFGFGVILLIAIMYCRFDNACYLKAEIQQSQTIEYFSSLVTRIKSTKGYADELPIVFVNQMQIEDLSITRSPEFEDIMIVPYTEDTHELVNNYVWKVYMNQWIGYSPVILDESAVSGNKKVEKMPSYPDDGSIKVIDGMVVIKF